MTYTQQRAAALRESRKRACLLQVDLAVLLGVSVDTIQRAEAGGAIKDKHIERWLRLCQVRPVLEVVPCP